jgi:hypothetical protein
MIQVGKLQVLVVVDAPPVSGKNCYLVNPTRFQIGLIFLMIFFNEKINTSFCNLKILVGVGQPHPYQAS